MGTDCYLRISRLDYLDRWYVFSNAFKCGKEYPYRVFLEHLNMLEDLLPYGDKANDRYKYWIDEARKLAINPEGTFTFFCEHHRDWEHTYEYGD